MIVAPFVTKVSPPIVPHTVVCRGAFSIAAYDLFRFVEQ